MPLPQVLGDSFLHAYVDESGNAGLDFTVPQGVSTHFVVSCILCDASVQETLNEGVEAIAQAKFSGGEIKSSSVGNNDRRRQEILRDILGLDFKIFALVVDKRELTTEGFRWSGSFHKYLNDIVHRALFTTFPRIRLHRDELGSKDFMDGFVKYVHRKHPIDLFQYAQFSFASSKHNRIVQLADFIAGTLLRCYSQDILSPKRHEYIAMLQERDHLIPVMEFPARRLPYSSDLQTFEPSKFDPVIADTSVGLAQLFIDENDGDTNEFVQEQVVCARYLLFQVLYGDPERYMLAPELVVNLHGLGLLKVNDKNIGRSVIGKLKDNGLLITSGYQGYKLAVNLSDLKQFVSYNSKSIGPMLSRLRKARERIALATQNEVDILGDPDFEYLRKFFDSVS